MHTFALASEGPYFKKANSTWKAGAKKISSCPAHSEADDAKSVSAGRRSSVHGDSDFAARTAERILWNKSGT